MRTMDMVERIATKFTVGDDCWEWTAARNPGGYGTVKQGDRTHSAHRVLYELLIGKIPDGMTLDHLCRNRGCVRPSHLEPVSRRDNTLRGIGITAAYAARTHCDQGHPYDEANTYRWRNVRICRACRRNRKRRRVH